jgi:hypothetical protein
MSFARQVAIGPEFFAKSKQDYSNYEWALVREFMQNSMDCDSNRIVVTCETVAGKTVLTVENDGDPMTEEILVGKLLALGGSGKNFAGTVGGFGKAKELLYFCHERYVIFSGKWRVEGSGAGYDIVEMPESFHGTRSTVYMDEDVTNILINQFQLFCGLAQWSGKVILNGRELDCDLRKGSPRRELSFGTVYTNKTYSKMLVLRMGGIPMFSHWVGVDRCVVVELKGTSADVLTANRDGLKWSYRSELDNFIAELTTDKRRALKTRYTEYTHYEGDKLQNQKRAGISARELVAFTGGGAVEEEQEEGTPVSAQEAREVAGQLFAPSPGAGTHRPGGTMVLERKEVRVAARQIQDDFVIRNNLGMKIPACYLPDRPEFGAYSLKMARIWGRLMLQLHELFDLESEFSIGFNFDEEEVAFFEQSSNYGKVYYINPCQVVKSSTGPRSLKKRFQLTDRDSILAAAVHEFTHGQGYSGHDGEYAAAVTANFAVVLKHRKSFNWCFGN